MATISDPAKELAELCNKLATSNRSRGDDHLASVFGFSAWSRDFYQVIFCIIERIDYLMELINSIDMDDDIRKNAKQHLKQIKSAFNRDSLSNAWNQHGLPLLGPQHVDPILMLSSAIRTQVKLPQLDQAEVDELLAMLSQLEEWLKEQQLTENDFIRQAIIDGVKHFRFRLENVGWFGWGYTIESLREVISAYMILQGTKIDPNTAPNAEAILKKVSAAIKTVYEKIGIVKDTVDSADFMLRVYGAVTLLIQSKQGIAGLLTHIK